METFKAKPVFIAWKRKYDNVKYGSVIHYFNMTVERENGMTDEGIFTTTKEDQTKFNLQEMVEMKTSSVTEDHELTTKFDKVSQQGAGSGGNSGGSGLAKKGSKKDKAILANVSMYCAFEFITNNNQASAVKDDLVGLMTLADKIYKFLSAAPDVQTSISLQACVKRTAEYLHLFDNVSSNTSTEALEAATKLNAWVTAKMNS